MKTITLYEFNELNEMAQKRAIDGLRVRCYEENSECIYENANCVISEIMDFAHVCPNMQNDELFYRNQYEIGNKTNKELFAEFKDRYNRDMSKLLVFTKTMDEIIDNYQFNEEFSYTYNISIILREFKSKINDIVKQYYEDKLVIDYIDNNEFYFLDNGKLVEFYYGT